MISPVKTINKKPGVFEKQRLTIQRVVVQVACVIIYYNIWSCKTLIKLESVSTKLICILHIILLVNLIHLGNLLKRTENGVLGDSCSLIT